MYKIKKMEYCKTNVYVVANSFYLSANIAKIKLNSCVQASIAVSRHELLCPGIDCCVQSLIAVSSH